jgi:hypothetical protein
MKRNGKDRNWTTLCRGRNCCPSIAVEGTIVYIKDDDGAQVKITLDQLDDIWHAAKAIRDGQEV